MSTFHIIDGLNRNIEIMFRRVCWLGECFATEVVQRLLGRAKGRSKKEKRRKEYLLKLPIPLL